MYIPYPPRPAALLLPNPGAGPPSGTHLATTSVQLPGDGPTISTSSYISSPLRQAVSAVFNLFRSGVTAESSPQPPHDLRRRRDGDNTNVTVGVTVGVLLFLFLAGCFAFLWIYRFSLSFNRRRRRKAQHRRKSTTSSKSSKASSDAAAPAAPPAEGG